MLRYFRELSRPKLLLWSYFVWYVFFVGRYFEAEPRLWLNSLGIAALIGTALFVSTAYAKAVGRTEVPPWAIFRFYLMPFCVSSFAATTKDRGFVLVFSPRAEENFVAFALVAFFVGSVEGSKFTRSTRARRKGLSRPLGGEVQAPPSSI